MTSLDYNVLLAHVREKYQSIKVCYCLVLKEHVYFTSKGFKHLQYDGKGHIRPYKERVERLLLLPFVVYILKHTKKVFEYRKIKSSEYWELQESISKVNSVVSVILRRTDSGGRVVFHSIWKK